MRVFLTGATGFVGWHVLRALLARGDAVRCLVRRESRAALAAALPADRVEGDLGDLDALRRGMDGAELVIHCAADYRLHVPDPGRMLETNVEGTRNVMRAAWECGVPKVVHTSTVGALGLPANGAPADESSPVSYAEMIGPYKRTKFLAERVAEEWAARGLPVVIVNPSTPVGERDVKPTATGRMIVDFLRRRMPAYVDTGLNLVDVKDVAEGHLLAAERGRVGRRYILGHRNMTLKEIADALSELSGVPAPRLRVPHWMPMAAAALSTGVARLAGGEPAIPLDAVRLSRHRMFFDSGRATRELGYRPSPVEPALRRAVEWFRAEGYAP